MSNWVNNHKVTLSVDLGLELTLQYEECVDMTV